MELRKNISQGSFWFAITTLVVFSIARCHRLASNDRQLAASVWSDSAMQLDMNNYQKQTRYYRNRKRFYPNKGKEGLDVSGAYQHYHHRTQKTLSPKLALELLLALRQTNGAKQRGMNAADSLRLGRELSVGLKQSNPYGSRPLAWNHMDSTQWDALPGIGPATARKIIRYRNKLGGFTHAQQLLEIPKIDTLLATLLAETFSFSPAEITKLNPNPNWSTLYKHPYVGPAKAKILHPFLAHHQPLTRQDWNQIQGLNREEKEKISPYLSFTD